MRVTDLVALNSDDIVESIGILIFSFKVIQTMITCSLDCDSGLNVSMCAI